MFHGYTFPGYRPTTPDPAPGPNLAQREAARQAGATHISGVMEL
jgi:hypothetical protein